MGFLEMIVAAPARLGTTAANKDIRISSQLAESAVAEQDILFEKLNTRLQGLTVEEAEARIEQKPR